MKAVLFTLAAALALPASATSHKTAPPQFTEAEVRKVDKAAGKVTLKHGPIKKFDMESMTMVFRVADPAMLDKMKAGDKIEFEADRVNGAITLTKIGKGP